MSSLDDTRLLATIAETVQRRDVRELRRIGDLLALLLEWQLVTSWPSSNPGLTARTQAALASIPAEPEQADEVAGLDALANDLYCAVVRPDTIWWDDLTPEMQDGWRRAAAVAVARLAPARDDTSGGAS